MVTLSLCVDLISLKIACDFVMNSVHYSKNTSSVILNIDTHCIETDCCDPETIEPSFSSIRSIYIAVADDRKIEKC